MRAALVRWGPVAGWMVLIYWLSSQPALPKLIPADYERLATTLAHLGEYFVLSSLWWRALTGVPTAGLIGRAVCVVVISIAYGLSDEGHQSFVPGRNAEWYDVAMDAIGAAFGVVFASRLTAGRVGPDERRR